MKKLAVSAVCFLLALSSVSFGQINGVITGMASVDGKPLPHITVRLRDLGSGQLVGTTNATATGQFMFSGLPPSDYVVETVDDNGTILGTSVTVALTLSMMVATNVTVVASAAALAAAGGTAALSATVVAVTAVAATLGTTASVVVANDASPSR
jgi:hypothetical protein